MTSYIEISKRHLLSNIALFRSVLCPGTKIAAVVKANAYGHGLKEVAQILEPVTDYFQVDNLQELEELRKFSNKLTLVLGYVSHSELEKALILDGILVVYDTERLSSIASIGEKLGKIPKVHLLIDSYFGRDGILPSDLDNFLQEFRRYEIDLDGVYAHFSDLEDPEDVKHSEKQILEYQRVLDVCAINGYSSTSKHISATSGILVYGGVPTINTIVRLGIGLYGLWPSEKMRKKFEANNFQLHPVLRWVSKVAQVKMLPPGFPIGYGRTFITKESTKIAVVPQGYSDGYDRNLSNVGEVLIGGTRCKVLGRISMNMFVADVSHLENVKQESEVVLLGTQNEEEITIDELSCTLSYEVVSRINPLLPRVVI